MKGYVAAICEAWHDEAERDLYIEKAGPALVQFGGTLLSVYGTHEDVESPPTQGIVLLEFPSYQQARDWYHSPAYQAALPHRLKGAKFKIVIFEGV